MSRVLESLGVAAQCIAAAAGELGSVHHLAPPAAGAAYERVDGILAQAQQLLEVARAELDARLTAKPSDRAALLERLVDERYPGRHVAGRERPAAAGPPATGRARVPRRLAFGSVSEVRQAYNRWQ